MLSVHPISLVGETNCKRNSEKPGGLGVGLGFLLLLGSAFCAGPSFSRVFAQRHPTPGSVKSC